MPQDSNLTDYQSIWNGQQIDEAIGTILAGDIDEAKNTAVEAAASAEQSAESAAASASTAQQYSGKPPKPQDGTWWIWNATTQQYVNSGISSTLTIKHSYSSIEEMNENFANTEENELAIISGSAEDVDTAKLYIHPENGTKWQYLSDLSGIQGPPGEDGTSGKSAYQEAVEGGYTGSEEQFKSMLASGPWLRTAGGSLSGNLIVGNIVISTYGGISSNASYGLEIASAVNFVDGFTTDSDVPINFNGSKLQGVDAPIQDTDAANKKFVVDTVANASEDSTVTYGTCSTSASISAKVVTASGFTLKTGAEIWVKFTNTNTATTPALNVNKTGVKQIKKYGSTGPNTYMWAPGAVVGFVYDGNFWVMVNGTTATTTYYGATKLSDSVYSTSTTEAATPNAVSQAYNAAIEAKSLTDRPIALAPEMYWPISGSQSHPDFEEVFTYVKAKFHGGNDVFFDLENEYAMEQYVNGIRIWCPPGYYFVDEGCGSGVSLIINGAYYSMEIVSEGGRNYLYSSVSYGYGFNFHVSGAVAIRPNLAKF